MLTVQTSYDSAAQTYTLSFKQQTPPTPGQPTKKAVLIPVLTGLLGPDGKELELKLQVTRRALHSPSGPNAQSVEA